jgi:hypothetical protein
LICGYIDEDFVKAGIYVKRLMSILLVVTMFITLCACIQSPPQKGVVGTKYTSEGVEFTLNYVEFTDAMDDWGGANDNFWKPLPENPSKNVLDNAVEPKSSDDTICIISYTAKNISKEDKVIDARGTLNYDDGYKYSEGGLSYRVSAEGVWDEIDNGIVLKKLKENEYEFRAYMVVPKELVENTDKSLTYELFNVEYDLR